MVLWLSMPRHQSLEKPLHTKMMRTNNNEQDKKRLYRSILSVFNVSFSYRHLIYGLVGDADCIMRPLTMPAWTSYSKPIPHLQSLSFIARFLIFNGFCSFLFLASLFLFALFHQAHKYFNACINGPSIQRMKPIRKYLYCATRIYFKWKHFVFVGNIYTECFRKFDIYQYFEFSISSQKVFYSTIN